MLVLLREHGLILQQDKVLPSVVGFIAGESLSTSWWRHRRARQIFQSLSALADHPDVLTTKLVAGKVTFVHRRLWPHLLAVAAARAAWQLKGITKEARELLAQVEKAGELLASGSPARELERRLLVHGEQVHTTAGKHLTRLETWAEWSRRTDFATKLSPSKGRRALERTMREIGGVGGELPWE
ncbi:MAG: hypothetical protein HY040_24735 [Planctomycetes bacterium]|nr:hypothetical protein [Planctomycetota bacterium]